MGPDQGFRVWLCSCGSVAVVLVDVVFDCVYRCSSIHSLHVCHYKRDRDCAAKIPISSFEIAKF